MHTAESNFSNFVIKYLREIKTEFENTLTCLSGAQMGLNHENNWRSKISWHTPFKIIFGEMAENIKKPFLLQYLVFEFPKQLPPLCRFLICENLT